MQPRPGDPPIRGAARWFQRQGRSKITHAPGKPLPQRAHLSPPILMHAVRPAVLTEVGALNALIHASATVLSQGYYTPPQIESLITHVFGVDTQLIRDRTYFVIEEQGELLACGGWSARRTLFGGDQAKEIEDPTLDPLADAARIRAFFVHPGSARRGLGRQLLHHCERAARAEGFSRAELMATLPGVPLYKALGYEPLESVTYPLPDGQSAGFIRMARSLE